MSWTAVTSFFYAVALLQTAVSAAAWPPDIHLLRRQSGLPPSVPPQCSNICNPALGALQACTPATVGCLCPPSLQSGLFDCFLCAGMAGQATDYSVPQSEIDSITVACDQVGAPLPVRTFPGQNPNRNLATSITVPQQASSTPAGQTPGSALTSTTSGATASSGVLSTVSSQTIISTSRSFSSTVASTNSPSPIIASTSSPSATIASPATASGNGADRGTSPIWPTAMGLFLEAIFYII